MEFIVIMTFASATFLFIAYLYNFIKDKVNKKDNTDTNK